MGLEGAEWQQEEDIRVRLGLRLRLRKFSVVSHCGKSLKVRAVRMPKPNSVNISGLMLWIDFQKNFRMGNPKNITTTDDISSWRVVLYGIWACPMAR